MNWYEWRDVDLVLRLRVRPRARQEGVTGLLDKRLRVCVKAPPVDGKANLAVRKFLALAFGARLGDIAVTGGATSHDKTLVVRAPARVPDWFTANGGEPWR